MKYNRSDIMKTAWEIRRTSGCDMSQALTTAWAATKAEIEAVEQAESYCGHCKSYRNNWQNYGKDRTYIGTKVYTNAWNLKRDIKAGYIDNLKGIFVAA